MTITELRNKCVSGREAFYGKENVADQILRFFSIYLTIIFLKLKLTANKVTILSIIVGIIGSVVVNFYLIAGLLIMYLYLLLDASDGEVARYNNASSPKGLYLDYIAYLIVFSTFLIFIPTSNTLINLTAFVAFVWFELAILANYKVFIEWNLKRGEKKLVESGKQKWYVALILQSVNYVEVITILLICAVIGISTDYYLIYYCVMKFMLACYNWYYEYKVGLERLI